MTTLIQQKGDNDCTLAAIAMAVGKQRWEDIWTPEDLASVVASKGISDMTPWFTRAGLEEHRDYRTIWREGSNLIKALLWKRRAMLSVDSLNNEYGSHSVYWDGVRIYDPQDGREGKLYHRLLTGCSINRVILFAQP